MPRAAVAFALLLVPALATAQPLSVRLLSQVDGSTRPPDAKEKLVRLGTGVTLFADVRGPGTRYDATAPMFPYKCDAQGVPKPCRVRWTKVEPAVRSLSNTDPTFHWHEIEYAETPIPACDDRFTCPADVRATKLGDRGGLGTMAFRVHVTLGERSGASLGPEKRHRGGLDPAMPRITVRRDDTFLGYLTELFNTPYIWGSAGSDAVHQAERRIGSDCADFVTYGVRRLGHDVPYTSTWQVEKYTRRIAALPSPLDDGTYRDAAGQPVPWSMKGAQPGDLVLFAGHVGALVRDEPPLGVLSASDVMIHTLWAEPVEQSIADAGYGSQPVKLLRWKVLDRR